MKILHSWIILVCAEMRRYIAEAKTYLMGTLGSFVSLAIVIALFILSSNAQNNPSVWVGYIFWQAAAQIMSEASLAISDDKRTGTFTQLMLRPTSMVKQITAKTLAWSSVNIVLSTTFFMLFFVCMGLPIGFTPEVLLAAFITFICTFGFTLVFSSLTILFTRITFVRDVVQNVMLLLSGAVIPLSLLPAPLVFIGRLMPIDLGIEIAQQSIMGIAIMPQQWLMLIIEAVIYLTLGYVVFQLIMAYGRKRGINMRY